MGNFFNSIKSFSKSCFEGMKSHSPKFTKVFSKLGIPVSSFSNMSALTRDYFAKEMGKAMADRKGYFLELNSHVKESVKEGFAGEDPNDPNKKQDSKTSDYDIGE